MSALRLLLAFAVKYGLEIHVLDVKNAYLNGEITTKRYMNHYSMIQYDQI